MATYRVPVLEDFSWQPPIEDKDLETAPTGAGVTKGKRYIVKVAGGNWSGGAAKDIATAKQNEPTETAHWMYDTPDEGWTVHVKDEDVNYVFDGSTWGKSPADDNASSIDSLEIVASAAIDSVDSLETVASAAIGSVDSLETVASTAITDISNTESSMGSIDTNLTNTDSSVGSIDTNVTSNESSIVSINTRATNIESSVGSINTAKQDKGTYVSAYGAIEFTI